MKNVECYLVSERGAPFLRLETPRDCRALSYGTLLGFEYAVDGTSIVLDFACGKVSLTGKRLHEVFISIAAGTCVALIARTEVELIAMGSTAAPIITDIRMKLVEKTMD